MEASSLNEEISRLFLALRSATDEALVSSGISSAQFGVLCALNQGPGFTNAELARRLAVTPQTTHTIVTGLVDAGLVVRQPHPAHRRLLALYLSNAGEAVVEESEPIVAEVEGRMAALLSEDEQVDLSRMLRLCVASLR